MKTWGVIAAAGESRRFQMVGYETPKPLLVVEFQGERRFMVEWVAMYARPVVDEIVIGLPEHRLSREITGGEEMSTNSHAETVRNLVHAIPDGDQVIVFDCDLLLETRHMRRVKDKLHVAGVSVAVGSGVVDGFSSADAAPWAARFREPNDGLSTLPVLGMRAFRRADELTWALEDQISMTGVVNALPPPYAAVLVDRWIDWGTPSALDASGARIV